MVTTANGVNIDFADKEGEIRAQHYARRGGRRIRYKVTVSELTRSVAEDPIDLHPGAPELMPALAAGVPSCALATSVHVPLALPKLETAADALTAAAALVDAVASGELTPSEAAELSKLVEGFSKALEAHEFQQRLERLEAAHQGRHRP